jgi:hypothetical protein
MQILLVLVAEVLEEFRVGSQMEVLRNTPRLRVDLAIVDGVSNVQVSEVAARETLEDSQRVAMGSTERKSGPVR